MTSTNIWGNVEMIRINHLAAVIYEAVNLFYKTVVPLVWLVRFRNLQLYCCVCSGGQSSVELDRLWSYTLSVADRISMSSWNKWQQPCVLSVTTLHIVS